MSTNRGGVVRDRGESKLDGSGAQKLGGMFQLLGGPEDLSSEFSIDIGFDTGSWTDVKGLAYDSATDEIAVLSEQNVSASVIYRTEGISWVCYLNKGGGAPEAESFVLEVTSVGDDCLLRVTEDSAQHFYTVHGSLQCTAGRDNSTDTASIDVTF